MANQNFVIIITITCKKRLPPKKSVQWVKSMSQSKFEIIKDNIQSLLLSTLVVSCEDVRRNLFFNFLVGLPIIFDKLPLLSRLLFCISSGKMSSSSSLEILFETYDQNLVTTLNNSTSRVDESTERVEIHLLQNDILEI